MEARTLNTIVIDDSKMQRTAINTLVEKHKNLKWVAEYKNGIEARIEMEKKKVDLVFLDIEMPIISGFDFIESLRDRPQIILITGKADYAMRAFDYDVTDYLLKPITTDRFNTSVKKALANYTAAEAEVVDDAYVHVNSKLKKLNSCFRLAYDGLKGVGDYIKFVTDDKNVLVLNDYESYLKRTYQTSKFMRIHKSYIINLDKVDNFNGAQVEVGGQRIPLSRHKKSFT